MTYGPLNEHAVGIILKELVRRAISAIRNERQIYEISHKPGYRPNRTDVFTTADTRAQEIYLKSIRECFPNHGIVAEENNLSIPAAHPAAGYFTIDPLDGTKAFIRGQSHGIGTMIALVENGQVTTAYIGDINTREIYGFRPGSLPGPVPGSAPVYRLTEFDTAEELGHEAKPFNQQILLLREPLESYSASTRNLSTKFRSYGIESGSIGIWTARLWKREVGAVILRPGTDTPWDTAPIIGISQALGYTFHKPSTTSLTGWEPYNPPIQPTTYERTHDLLILHHEDLHLIQS